MKVLRCKRTFIARLDGQQVVVRTGDLVADNDPIVKRREEFFESAEDHVAKRAEGVVERATAEPGKKRSIGRPRKSAAELTPESAPRTAAEAKAAGVKLDESKLAAKLAAPKDE